MTALTSYENTHVVAFHRIKIRFWIDGIATVWKCKLNLVSLGCRLVVDGDMLFIACWQAINSLCEAFHSQLFETAFHSRESTCFQFLAIFPGNFDRFFFQIDFPWVGDYFLLPSTWICSPADDLSVSTWKRALRQTWNAFNAELSASNWPEAHRFQRE